MNYSVERARAILRTAGLFFCDDPSELDEDEDERFEWLQTLNLNDTWGWATADGEYVPDNELPRVAELFWRYGWCGVLFWVSERRNQCRSEFHDVNRMIEFARHEENIRDKMPSSTQRAYSRQAYTIGGPEPGEKNRD